MYDKKQEIRSTDEKPETIENRLFDELSKIGLDRLPELPQHMPQAIEYWIKFNEPYDVYTEKPRLVPVQGKEDKARWMLPYLDRLVYTLRKFANLTSKDRQIVIAGVIEEKVPWRGDDLDFYLKVVDESLKMRKIGVDAYRKEAIKKMKAYFSGGKLDKEQD